MNAAATDLAKDYSAAASENPMELLERLVNSYLGTNIVPESNRGNKVVLLRSKSAPNVFDPSSQP